MPKIASRSEDVIEQAAASVNTNSGRTENINQNQNQIEVLTEKPQSIDFEDRQKRYLDEIAEPCMQSKRKRKRKIKKISKINIRQTHPKQDTLRRVIPHELANEFYLYHLFYDYHFSLLKKYENDRTFLIVEQNHPNFNPDRIQNATSSIELCEDDAKLVAFISRLYNNDILEPNEKRLLEYSLQHRYLSEDTAKLSNSVEKPNENQIAEAIHDLILGPEKEKFEELFRIVYKNTPFTTVNKKDADNSTESSSTVLRAQIDELVKSKADNWDFHEKELSDADLKIIAGALTTNKSCKNLDLRHNKITAVGAHYLSEMLCVNHALKALLLSYNNICNSGLQYLCDAMANPINSLELLYLNKNGITEESATALAKMLKLNKSLTDLSLNYNQIGDSGVRALCSVLKSDNTTLKHLYLHGNQITDSGVDAIIEMTESHHALEQIKLEDNQISTKCQQQLQRAVKEDHSFRSIPLTVLFQ